MYIYHALINALGAHIIHINLFTTFTLTYSQVSIIHKFSDTWQKHKNWIALNNGLNEYSGFISDTSLKIVYRESLNNSVQHR